MYTLNKLAFCINNVLIQLTPAVAKNPNCPFSSVSSKMDWILKLDWREVQTLAFDLRGLAFAKGRVLRRPFSTFSVAKECPEICPLMKCPPRFLSYPVNCQTEKEQFWIQWIKIKRNSKLTIFKDTENRVVIGKQW